MSNLHKSYQSIFLKRDIGIHDIADIRHEHMSPTSWKLGYAIKIYPGSDGHVRVVDVSISNGVVKRPITKL